MRDGKALAELLDKAGFILVRWNKHQIWHCPCGRHRITAASTCGGGSGFTNARLQLARAQRDGCKPNETRTA
jgi:hypothetical protein